MLKTLWKMLGQHTLCGAALLTVANLVQAQGGLPTIPQAPVVPAVAQDAPKSKMLLPVTAQEPAPVLGVPSVTPAAPVVAPSNADEKARMERLEKQVQDLTNALKAVQNRPAPVSTEVAPGSLTTKDVQSIINGYFAEKEEQDKAKVKAHVDAGYKVGTDLSMKASWQNGVVFETPNKDFYMRAGFRFQWDNVWFKQDATNIKAAPAGVGRLIDGDYFRRVRPNFNGGFWEVGEFNVELKMESITNGMAGMDDVWVGVKGIPGIGTVRLGHMHLPHGLEADMWSSSKPMTFFEVSSANNAFFSGERTGSGVMFTNAFLDERTTYNFTVYRPENAGNGADFSQGDYAAILRLTGLPIYENDGRCLLHIGGSATWRHARNNTAAFSTQAELLDQAGGDNGYGNGVTVNTGGVPAQVTGFAGAPGNKTAWVTTGSMFATSTSILNAELLYIRGPFSVQAEWDWAYINGTKKGTLGFNGGYVQAGYFLTGENRTYDKRLGRLGSEYIKAANTPFWLVRGEDGRFNYGLGAWELAARFSHIDLNQSGITGGVFDQVELGVNWHLNNNFRLQFMYLHADRYDMPKGGPGSGMDGFGIRTQLTF